MDILFFFRYDPILTYGHVKHDQTEPFQPHFVMYDKVVLTFHAFFKQGIPESDKEYYRIRYVNIMYFMEDDTITVMEPPILVKFIILFNICQFNTCFNYYYLQLGNIYLLISVKYFVFNTLKPFIGTLLLLQ